MFCCTILGFSGILYAVHIKLLYANSYVCYFVDVGIISVIMLTSTSFGTVQVCYHAKQYVYLNGNIVL